MSLPSRRTTPPVRPDSSRIDRRYEGAALLLWLTAWLVVAVLVARDPTGRTVTPVFHDAVRRWWARESLYSGSASFHYMPQFALLFTPFHFLPAPWGDILWRLAAVAACVYGLRDVARRLAPGSPGRFFFVSSMLSLAPCLGAVRNGQTNLLFGGVSVVAAIFLADSRWGWAAACLVGLVAIKPLGLVLLALAVAAYPRIRRPALLGLALFAAAPFLFAPPAYVADQYGQAIRHLADISTTTERRFADIAGLAAKAGIELSGAAWRPIRALAGAFTLVLAVLVARREDAIRRSLALVLLAGLYLMLFNPMTEKNSYAIVAPVLGVFAAGCLAAKATAPLGWWLVFVLVSIGLFPELLWRVDRNFGLWWDPLMMLTVFAAAAARILTREPLLPARGSGDE